MNMGIAEWFIALGENSSMLIKGLITFFVSLLPIVELRGAIPVGAALGLPHLTTFIISYIGNLLPAPFIILFIRRIFEWMKKKSDRLGRIAEKFEKRAETKKGTIEKYKFWGLLLFVAIPLPGTGAWTGALVAAMMDMRLKRAMPAIILGVLIAGVIVTTVTYGAGALFG
jgi:uncharacterized membrane protein